jgi:hypothetical protein
MKAIYFILPALYLSACSSSQHETGWKAEDIYTLYKAAPEWVNTRWGEPGKSRR